MPLGKVGDLLTKVAGDADSMSSFPLTGAMTNGAAPPPLAAACTLSGAIGALLTILQVTLGTGSVAWRTAEAYLSGDEAASVDEVAERAGFTNRHRLRRSLAAEGFNGPSHLMGTLRIARWLWTAETMGESISAQSLRVGRDSAVAHRLIKARTGLTWTECRRRGLVWFVETYLTVGTTCQSRSYVSRAGEVVRSSPGAA